MKLRPYNDPDYRRARKQLTHGPTVQCWKPLCDNIATTIDHDPPLALHTHRRGSGCCRLMPCCATHNYSAGAALGNTLRRPRSGWA